MGSFKGKKTLTDPQLGLSGDLSLFSELLKTTAKIIMINYYNILKNIK